MADAPTISKSPPVHPGLDFDALYHEGVDLLAKWGGAQWTDFNSSDPGVTILEQLCYGITDLAYRLDFPIADLLADHGGQVDESLFSAAEILTTRPVTVNDLRRLLIDVPGVRNAWLEPAAPDPPIQLRTRDNVFLLGDTDSETGDDLEVRLQGLLNVLIQREPWSQASSAGILERARERLASNRLLCVDYTDPQILESEKVKLEVEIEIAPITDGTELLAEIYFALDNAIAPRVPFQTLTERQQQGLPPEAIFAGPVLHHGFIDDRDLDLRSRKTELHASDLIRALMDVPGVKLVTSITMTSAGNRQDWVLPLSPDHVAVFDLEASSICLRRGSLTAAVDRERANQRYVELAHAQAPQLQPSASRDLPIPSGRDRDVAQYQSIREHFPAIYAVVDGALPDDAPPERKAQARQLVAYLMLFEQHLANLFSQASRVGDQFSFRSPVDRTYFSQVLETADALAYRGEKSGPDITDRENLEALLETRFEALRRKNRMLDHLLARFAEKFDDYALVTTSRRGGEGGAESLALAKQAFLSDYPELSGNRGGAPSLVGGGHSAVGGLQQRIERLLGFDEAAKALPGANHERFIAIEHILLRPTVEPPFRPADFLALNQPIESFAQGENGGVHCSSPDHGLQDGESVRLIDSQVYDGVHVVSVVDADIFSITAIHDAKVKHGYWTYLDEAPDPWSCQISFVFPQAVGRFADANFREFTEQVVRAETPAHITAYLLWLDNAEFQRLEQRHEAWWQRLPAPGRERDKLARLLMWNLGMGRPADEFSWLHFHSDTYITLNGPDGSHSYDGVLGKLPRTVDTWVRARTDGVTRMIVNWGAATNGWYLAVADDGALAVGATSHDLIKTTTPIADAEWHHIAVTLPNEATLKQAMVYIDGIPEPSEDLRLFGTAGDLVVDTGSSEKDVWLGRESGAYGLIGQLAHLRIWSVEFSNSEVQLAMGDQSGGRKEGLEGHWPLNEKVGARMAADVSGNLRHGRISGAAWDVRAEAPLVRQEVFENGMALYADGLNDRIMVDSYRGVIGANARTVEAWVKPEPNGGDMPITSWGDSSADGTRWTVFISGGGNLKLYAGSGGRNVIHGNTNIPAGEWTHIACVLPRLQKPAIDNVRLYVNGQIETEPVIVSPKGSINTAKGWTVRLLRDTNDHYYQGWIADYRLWSVARTEKQIHDTAEYRLLGDEEGLEVYFPFRSPPDTDTVIVDGRMWVTTDNRRDASLGGKGEYPISQVTFPGGPGNYISVKEWFGIEGGAPRTVEAWIMPSRDPEQLGQIQSLMQWGDFGAGNGKRWSIILNNHGQVECDISGAHANGEPRIRPGVWTHIAVVLPKDSATISDVLIFVGGQQVEVQIAGDPTLVVDTQLEQKNPFGIGYASYNKFHGKLAEVKVWQGARSSYEIQSGRRQGLKPDDVEKAGEALVGYWPLKNAHIVAGDWMVDDLGPNGWDGTLEGSGWKLT